MRQMFASLTSPNAGRVCRQHEGDVRKLMALYAAAVTDLDDAIGSRGIRFRHSDTQHLKHVPVLTAQGLSLPQ